MAHFQVPLPKRISPLALALLALLPLFISSCNTSKYAVTDGVYYNPMKDKNKLDEAVGRGEPAYTVVDKRGESEVRNPVTDSDTRPKVYTETDTIRYNNGNVVINNYNGDYYDFDGDYAYSRRINQFYYPSATAGYYSAWGMYGPGGVVVTNYYYDPWFYDPWYSPGVAVSYNYGYGYSYYSSYCAQPRYGCGYYSYNCGYNCFNPCGYGNCGYGYNPGWRGNRYNRGYRNGYNDGYYDGYYGYNDQYGDPRWNTNQPNSGFGPRSTVYTLGTTPDNGGRKDLPHRMTVPASETATVHVDDHLVNRPQRAKPGDIGQVRSEPMAGPYRNPAVGNDISNSNSGNRTGVTSGRTLVSKPGSSPSSPLPKEYTLATRNTARNGSAPANDHVMTLEGRNTVTRTRETTPRMGEPAGRPINPSGGASTEPKERATIASPNTGSRPSVSQRNGTATTPTNSRIPDTYRPTSPSRGIGRESGNRTTKPSTPVRTERPTGTVRPQNDRPSSRVSTPSGSSRTTAPHSGSNTTTKPSSSSPSRPSSGSKTLPKR